MFNLWLILMALGVSVITIFLVLRIGNFSGRWSTRRDRLFVAAMTLLGTIIFSSILWWLGLLLLGESGALILSVVGEVIIVVVLLVLTTRSTHTYANEGRGLAPTRPDPEHEPIKTPTAR
ncbi:MAG: hypothetical protein ABI690_29870 [Chloroflexota bacterium]